MPGRIVDCAVRGHQWCNQEQKRPRRQDAGFEHLPPVNDLARHRQRQQELGFLVSKQVGEVDDDVAEQQQQKKECE